jgi:hypothetical protein
MDENLKNVPLLTETDFAKAVCLAPVTIRKKRGRGEISFYRFGRAIRYSWAMVEEFKQRHKQVAAIKKS